MKAVDPPGPLSSLVLQSPVLIFDTLALISTSVIEQSEFSPTMENENIAVVHAFRSSSRILRIQPRKPLVNACGVMGSQEALLRWQSRASLWVGAGLKAMAHARTLYRPKNRATAVSLMVRARTPQTRRLHPSSPHS